MAKLKCVQVFYRHWQKYLFFGLTFPSNKILSILYFYWYSRYYPKLPLVDVPSKVLTKLLFIIFIYTFVHLLSTKLPLTKTYRFLSAVVGVKYNIFSLTMDEEKRFQGANKSHNFILFLGLVQHWLVWKIAIPLRPNISLDVLNYRVDFT